MKGGDLNITHAIIVSPDAIITTNVDMVLIVNVKYSTNLVQTYSLDPKVM